MRITANKLATYMQQNGYGSGLATIGRAYVDLYREINGHPPAKDATDSLIFGTASKLRKG